MALWFYKHKSNIKYIAAGTTIALYAVAAKVKEGDPMASNSSKRGLASASPETRKRVARAGGKASHGGGRKKAS